MLQGECPLKYLWILMPAHLWHLICTNFLHWCRICYSSAICCIIFGANLASRLKEWMQEQYLLNMNGQISKCCEIHTCFMNEFNLVFHFSIPIHFKFDIENRKLCENDNKLFWKDFLVACFKQFSFKLDNILLIS